MTTTRRRAQGQGQGVRVRARATQPNPSTCITEQNRHRVEGRVGQAGIHTTQQTSANPNTNTNTTTTKKHKATHDTKKETPRARDQEQSVNIQRTSSARTTLEPNSHDASELDDDILAEIEMRRRRIHAVHNPTRGGCCRRKIGRQSKGGSPRVLPRLTSRGIQLSTTLP